MVIFKIKFPIKKSFWQCARAFLLTQNFLFWVFYLIKENSKHLKNVFSVLSQHMFKCHKKFYQYMWRPLLTNPTILYIDLLLFTCSIMLMSISKFIPYQSHSIKVKCRCIFSQKLRNCTAVWFKIFIFIEN